MPTFIIGAKLKQGGDAVIIAPGWDGKGHAIGLALVGAALVSVCAGAGAGCGALDDVEPPTPGQRRIVSLSRAGSLSCGGQPPVSFSFTDGTIYADLRNALLDSHNFGPQGVVPVTFVLRPTIDRVRPRTLDRADLLVVNNPSAMIDETALATIAAFVARGGSVISLGDDASTFLAKKGECVADPEADLVNNEAASAIVAGPFGPVDGPVTTGYNCAFSDIAPGVVVLAQNDKGAERSVLDAASTDPRAGRAVAFGDDEIFSNAAGPACGSGKLTPGSRNEILALNTFAFLALARPSSE